jgi:glycosyltransferase involved in cell wall biosynthesis
MPRVSVVIPCYNQGHYLPEAVASVLRQAFNDHEIIIVNDGSNDDVTRELLHSYTPASNTFVVNSENQGLASARNNGIRVVSGEYILPPDADDTIEPHYLQKAIICWIIIKMLGLSIASQGCSAQQIPNGFCRSIHCLRWLGIMSYFVVPCSEELIGSWSTDMTPE